MLRITDLFVNSCCQEKHSTGPVRPRWDGQQLHSHPLVRKELGKLYTKTLDQTKQRTQFFYILARMEVPAQQKCNFSKRNMSHHHGPLKRSGKTLCPLQMPMGS